jgi:hypothetical protein
VGEHDAVDQRGACGSVDADERIAVGRARSRESRDQLDGVVDVAASPTS